MLNKRNENTADLDKKEGDSKQQELKKVKETESKDFKLLENVNIFDLSNTNKF